MIGNHIKLASLSRPLDPVRYVKKDAKNDISEDNENTRTTTTQINKIHKDFLNFSIAKSLPNQHWVRDLNNSEKDSMADKNPNLKTSFDDLPVALNPRANINTTSRITCYEDLRVIEKYAERQIIYGNIKPMGKLLRTRIEIITFCMKKYIVFKAYK